jgi:hypothetical protein
MVAFLMSAKTGTPERFLSEDGDSFYCPYTAKEFLEKFGILVMGRFADGKIEDVGDNFMFGALYDEDMFDAGSIHVVYGTLFIDAASAVDGSRAEDLTQIMGSDITKVPLMYDGAADGEIAFTYWLAREDSGGGSGGSSGCSAGFPLGVVILALLCTALGDFGILRRAAGKFLALK